MDPGSTLSHAVFEMREEVLLELVDLVGRSEQELNAMTTASAAIDPNEFRSDMVPPYIWRLAKQTLCQIERDPICDQLFCAPLAIQLEIAWISS
jgi:hypothetical protein